MWFKLLKMVNLGSEKGIFMKDKTSRIIDRERRIRVLPFFAIIFFAISMTVAVAWGHGGKSHAESFTALQALQKATELYDQLIVRGKLDESWETGLNAVEVTVRDSNDRKEYRVGFHRQSGSPEAVYIFFSPEGEYGGSNFDGKW